MPKILSEEERKKSQEKRLEYLKQFREEHGMDYYNNNKDTILKKRREKRELEKGSPLRTHNIINFKNMTKEEKNEYFRIKNKERRLRKKEEKLNG
jgi:hypothetical protein